MKYTAYVSYPQNPDMTCDSMPSEGCTIQEAESRAIADSATNCPRILTVCDNETGRTVKGPYNLR
jgi:hypothetical protein